MHEQAGDALGVHCRYQLIEIAGAGREQLRALLDDVRRRGFAGVNVTYPYKEAVLDLLDELSPTASAIGAVNAIVVRDGRLIGYNTDTTGFARAAARLVTESGRGSVAVIGAGGVGKAIVFALAGLGVAEIRIFDAGLTDAAEEMIAFFKLDHLTDETAGGLSYGQQKLLDAAVAFMGGPRLVLLDEPAGGVNLTLLADLKERLAAINREKRATFVVIEHNMEFVMSLCSRIMVMAEGKVLAMGRLEEIRANPAVIEAYLGH